MNFWVVYTFLALTTIIIWLSLSFSSVQFSRSVVSDSLRPHESQHTRPPCPSPTPGVHSDSCPSSQWCHPAISSSVVPFSSCPQSLPASESFPVSQLFALSISIPRFCLDISFHFFWVRGVELLNHKVFLFLTFWRTALLFSKLILYSCQQCMRISVCPHPPNTCCCLSLVIAILVGVECCVINSVFLRQTHVGL